MSMDDPYRLERFTTAQDAGGTYSRVIEELRQGRKTTHWMWFVFPQIAGLGQSSTSKAFAISSLGEAQAYLQHPVLGPRLVECTQLVADSEATTPEDVFGTVDARKFHSSMTLFMRAAPDNPLYELVLDRFFDGRPDVATDQRL
jgi:uncharacterized protein (DUF1810 family)